ncbi:hypothetical protein DBR24_05520 [Pseudomonas sp. HMWF006]|nr:hypothetical protein DBR24_05520 [Pseudomonas sp. HMWF006]PTT65917.1 hypothetical protein DBR26_18630 [Pseudomonas sp. HMWF007]PTT87490.1 hypothetical protein DBR29_19895 [Pseudomonas sp. HMWF005]
MCLSYLTKTIVHAHGVSVQKTERRSRAFFAAYYAKLAIPIPLKNIFGVHFNLFKYSFPFLEKLPVQFLEFIFV